jgi:hypothetical protein
VRNFLLFRAHGATEFNMGGPFARSVKKIWALSWGPGDGPGQILDSSLVEVEASSSSESSTVQMIYSFALLTWFVTLNKMGGLFDEVGLGRH